MLSSITKTPLRKILYFFLTKMIVGIGVIVSLVALIEWLRSSLLDKTNLPGDLKTLIVAIAEAFVATAGYIFIFRRYDNRRICELDKKKFTQYAVAGFFTGILLQASFILIIYIAGTYSVINVNSLSTLASPFAFALTAGFVAEIILVGIVFRLLEEQTGTVIALLVFIALFAVLHVNVKGATPMSVGATAIQAGLMLPAAFVYSRNLWLPVFLHFGWDLAEPGIFGAINPSSSLTEGLLKSDIAGNSLLTGGITGPQNSLSSLLLCFLLGMIFLLWAKQKNNIIKPRLKSIFTNNVAPGKTIS